MFIGQAKLLTPKEKAQERENMAQAMQRFLTNPSNAIKPIPAGLSGIPYNSKWDLQGEN